MSLLTRLKRVLAGGGAERRAPRLSEEQAIVIARAVARDHGWTWLEPAVADWIPGDRQDTDAWEVTSNASGRGTNVRVRIDDRTGAVLEKAFLPR